MSHKQLQVFFLSFASVVTIYIIIDVYRGYQNLKFQEHISALSKIESLHKDIDRYRSCNRNPGCENLYPEAARAIKEAEDKVTKELEKKSRYKE